MAIAWNVQIDVIDLSEKRVCVIATRVDDALPDDPWTYSLEGSVDTSVYTLAQIRTALVDQIWANWQAHVAKEVQITDLLSGWESALESDLQDKETA